MGLSDKERTEIIFEGINALVTRSIRFEDECGDKGLLGTGVGNRILITERPGRRCARPCGR
jgi:hypothetical protein